MTIQKNKKIAVFFMGIFALSVLGFLFAPAKKAQAQIGASFDITLKDIERRASEFKKKYGKLGEFAFQTLRKRYLVMIQNDLVNWVQGNGKPRFITNPGDFMEEGLTSTAAREIDKLFLSENINICSPFRANVRFLVSKPLLLKEESVRCSLGDMVDNLENFAQNFENGGWTAWLKLHETRNTLPGSYLAASELIGAKVAQSGNTVQATLSAGKGFLDQKLCSQAKYPKYIVRFMKNTGDTKPYKIDPVPKQTVYLFAEGIPNNWVTVWDKITTEPYYNVDASTIELENTGEFITSDPFIPPIKTPNGATCTQEETVTPGSTVGEWVTQGLLKGSVDTIINADELGQIVNAVIDAYINKAAREGLSKVQSGRGSYTTPNKTEGGTYTNLGQVRTEQLGFESPEATSLLNRLLGFQNRAGQLISQINSLTQGEDQAENFKIKLEKDITAQHLSSNDQKTGGINIGGATDEIDDIIARLYSRRHFNDESRNPGPYVANKVFHEVIGNLWKSIEQKLTELENSTNAQIPDSCPEIPDVRFYTSPRKEALPFTDGDGKVIVWRVKEAVDMLYQNTLDLRGEDKVKSTTPEIWKRDYLTVKGLVEAESIKDLNKNTAETYAESITSSKTLAETFQTDLNEMSAFTPTLSRYVSLLTDYDRAARDTGAAGTMQNYSAALNSNDEIELNILRTNLLTSQYEARARWRSDQQAIFDNPSTPLTEKDRATEKIRVMGLAIEKIETSLRALAIQDPGLLKELVVPPDPNTTAAAYVSSTMPITGVINLISHIDSIDFIKNGTSVSTAVAEALDLNIDGIESDLEQRESRVNSYTSDVANIIGNFLTKQDQDEVGNVGEKTKELGVTGGESEWEKYYKNRFQLAYAALIYDFYTNRFECVGR